MSRQAAKMTREKATRFLQRKGRATSEDLISLCRGSRSQRQREKDRIVEYWRRYGWVDVQGKRHTLEYVWTGPVEGEDAS